LNDRLMRFSAATGDFYDDLGEMVTDLRSIVLEA
jgi:hypothetical protein